MDATDTSFRAIDKTSPLPYYVQLRNILADEIARGTWKFNDQIPSEPEMCDMFDISRTVVRQALKDLVNEGKLIREKGRGTFVAKPKSTENLIQNLTGLYETARARGDAIRTRVLRFDRIQPPDYVAEKLDLGPGEDVIVLDRLRYINGEPRSLDITYLPYKLVPELLDDDLSTQSLYELIEDKYKLTIVSGHRTVEAIKADRRAAELLRLEPGEPVLLLTSVSYLDDHRVIEYFEAQHPGRRSRFEVDLVRKRSH